MANARAGDRVRVHYTGKLEDGTVFDSSHGQDPIEFEVGGDEIIAGLSSGVSGMDVGETKTLKVQPEEAYGHRNEDLINTVPRSKIPQEAEVGDQLLVETPETTFPVWVKDLNDEIATLDRNHPLAGETLVFEVELVGFAGGEA